MKALLIISIDVSLHSPEDMAADEKPKKTLLCPKCAAESLLTQKSCGPRV